MPSKNVVDCYHEGMSFGWNVNSDITLKTNGLSEFKRVSVEYSLMIFEKLSILRKKETEIRERERERKKESDFNRRIDSE